LGFVINPLDRKNQQTESESIPFEIIEDQMKTFTAFIILLFLLNGFPQEGHAQKKPSLKKIVLNLETAPDGSAVSVNSDEEFARMKAVDHFGSVKKERVMFSVDLSSGAKERRVRIDLDPAPDQDQKPSDQIPSGGASLPERAALKAEKFLAENITSVNVNGSVVRIDRDCSHFVRAAYWEASNHTVDLFEESIATGAAGANSGSGVVLLGRYFEKNYRYRKGRAAIGDVIIFDNTWDKNKNRIRDDLSTHTGIVTAIRDDGTIEFVHGNVGNKIKKGYINFQHPSVSAHEGKPVNSYLRPKYSWETDGSKNLAVSLVNGFGGYSM
jgi:hypothetical protein